jgi:hypothetical protein
VIPGVVIADPRVTALAAALKPYEMNDSNDFPTVIAALDVKSMAEEILEALDAADPTAWPVEKHHVHEWEAAGLVAKGMDQFLVQSCRCGLAEAAPVYIRGAQRD